MRWQPRRGVYLLAALQRLQHLCGDDTLFAHRLADRREVRQLGKRVVIDADDGDVFRNAQARSSDGPDGAQSEFITGVLSYTRSDGFRCVTNFTDQAIPLPEGLVILSSAPLIDGRLPAESTAWLLS